MRAISLFVVLAVGATAAPGTNWPAAVPNPALAGRAYPTGGSHWTVSQFKNLISFGDSYTAEGRLDYFSSHNGQPPPPGTFFPQSNSTSSGGRTWPRYVVQYTGTNVNSKWTPQITLYNYAVGGAVCDNDITPRFLSSINQDFPSVRQYEVPAFLADRTVKRNGTSQPYFQPERTDANSVYTMWDGTNDIGVNCFFTDSQQPGYVLTDYTDCIFNQFDSIYNGGGRYFVLMNLAPLDLTPLYANASAGGVAATGYWPNKPQNLTDVADRMKEYVTLVNEVWQYRIPFETIIAGRYPGVHFALYDVHRLITDIYTRPSGFLNGTAPANVTGFQRHVDSSGTIHLQGSPDSYLWWDELHPSEQTDRIIAREFVELLKGTGKYATYFDG